MSQKSHQPDTELGALTTDEIWSAIDTAFRSGQSLHGAGEESTTSAVNSLVTSTLVTAMRE